MKKMKLNNTILWGLLIILSFINIFFTFMYGNASRSGLQHFLNIAEKGLRITSFISMSISIAIFVFSILFFVIMKNQKIKRQTLISFIISLLISLLIMIMNILDITKTWVFWPQLINYMCLFFYFGFPGIYYWNKTRTYKKQNSKK